MLEIPVSQNLPPNGKADFGWRVPNKALEFYLLHGMIFTLHVFVRLKHPSVFKALLLISKDSF